MHSTMKVRVLRGEQFLDKDKDLPKQSSNVFGGIPEGIEWHHLALTVIKSVGQQFKKMRELSLKLETRQGRERGREET